jgi:hypothetical protein
MFVPSIREPQRIASSQITHESVEIVPDFRTPRRELELAAECLGQKGGVDLYPAVRVERAAIFNESKHSELIHKEVNARAGRADHRCQGLLRYSAESVQLAPIPGPCEQQKCAGKSPLAVMRNLVD